MKLYKSIISRLKKEGRLSLFSLLMIPFIAFGLAIVGLQTYNCITGQPTAPFSFDVGSLWSNESKEAELPFEGFVKKSVQQQPLRITSIDQEVIPKPKIRNTSPRPKILVSSTIQPQVSVMPVVTRKLDKLKFDPRFVSQLKSLNYTGTLSPLKAKYLSRLEQDYLINSEVERSQKKWYAGITFAPMLSYRVFSLNDELLDGVLVSGNTRYSFGLTEKDRNLSDQTLPSFSIGADIGRRIGNRLTLHSGIYYSTYGEQLSITQVDKSNPNVVDASFHSKTPEYQAGNTAQDSSILPYSNRYAYIEIPIGFEYKLLSVSNVDVSLDLAFAMQRLDHVDALIYDFESDFYYWFSSKDNGIFRIRNYNASIGLSISQYIGSSFELFAKPTLIYNLKSTYNDSYPAIQNQYSTGLRLGFKQYF